MIKRIVTGQVEKYLNQQNRKIFFIWGPRRSGKTTVLKDISKRFNIPIFNFDFISDRELFIPSRENLAKIAAEHKTILIDEVQNHPECTIAIKILHDEFNVKVIATGSSELRQKSEKFDSLAGRYIEAYCLPLSIKEAYKNEGIKAYEHESFTANIANNIQVYGAYPEVWTKSVSDEEKIDLLQNIFNAFVLKDIVNIYGLKNEKLAKDILLKLALQIGSEVSYREIAESLGANTSTVSNYIEIFIKNYILIPLHSFKVNIRRAVSENRKLYFYDMGIRNILVKDFRELDLRPDRGGVFENFVISEIDKKIRNSNKKASMYFYREYSGREIDLVLEDYKKKYNCIEIKVNKGKPKKGIFPLTHSLDIINTGNYYDKIDKL